MIEQRNLPHKDVASYETATHQATLSRRRFLGSAGALWVALASFPALASGAPTAAGDDHNISAALVAALAPPDLAEPAAAQYASLVAAADTVQAARLRAGLAEINSAMEPSAVAATPAEIRAALRSWIPRPRVAPPETAGDPALIRAAARLHRVAPKLDDPSSWAVVEPCAFEGDPTYASSFALDERQLRTARRVNLAVTLVDTLVASALPVASEDARPRKHESCGRSLV